MVYLLRRFKPRTNPTTLGVVMIFFALIYVITVLFVPAYLEASTTSIQTNGMLRDVIPVLCSILILMALGFILRKIEMAEAMPKTKGG
jgi:predicted transporter